jgi:hypothetical protein
MFYCEVHAITPNPRDTWVALGYGESEARSVYEAGLLSSKYKRPAYLVIVKLKLPRVRSPR